MVLALFEEVRSHIRETEHVDMNLEYYSHDIRISHLQIRNGTLVPNMWDK
jgi:hypothetical protein